MKSYNVILEKIIHYSIEVEAENEVSAKEEAHWNISQEGLGHEINSEMKTISVEEYV